MLERAGETGLAVAIGAAGVKLGQVGAATEARAGTFGSGKGPHTAFVTVYRNGEIVAADTLVSGNMTTEEAALGFPRSTLATHTEARAMKIPMQAGDTMIIEGHLEPCNNCKGSMNRAAKQTGAEIHYVWDGQIWSPGGR